MFDFEIPNCCRNCYNLEPDGIEPEAHYWSCKLNIKFPTKKLSCKKQEQKHTLSEGKKL